MEYFNLLTIYNCCIVYKRGSFEPSGGKLTTYSSIMLELGKLFMGRRSMEVCRFSVLFYLNLLALLKTENTSLRSLFHIEIKYYIEM